METVTLIRKFAAAVGVGLVIASLVSNWGNDIIARAGGHEFTYDGSSRVLLISLVSIAGLILLASVMFETERFLSAAGAAAAVILGFYIFVPLSLGLGQLGDLEYGSWFGFSGAALIVLGATPMESLISRQKEPNRTSRSGYVAWLLGLVGLGMVMLALDMALRSEPIPVIGRATMRTYWNSAGVPSGDNTLGIALIILVAIAAVSALASAFGRWKMFGGWAIGFTLITLGVVLYMPATLALEGLVRMRTGSGLALEGGLLAAGAMTAAVLARRGRLELGRSSLRPFVAIVGLGLALAGAWTETFSREPGSFWGDWTLGGLVTLLIVFGVLLAGARLFDESWPLLSVVSLIGWTLSGYFSLYLFQAIPTVDTLGPATWLGVAGGAVAGFSAIPLRLVTSWHPRAFELTSRRALAWLVAGTGLALVLVSLWLDLESRVRVVTGFATASYWDFNGDHSLGVAMLALLILASVALVGSVATRIPALVALLCAATFSLLGIALFFPAFEAFNRLGELRAGAWLALVGSLLAAAGSLAIGLLDKPLASVKPIGDAKEDKPMTNARAKGRRSAKGSRVPGSRAKK